MIIELRTVYTDWRLSVSCYPIRLSECPVVEVCHANSKINIITHTNLPERRVPTKSNRASISGSFSIPSVRIEPVDNWDLLLRNSAEVGDVRLVLSYVDTQLTVNDTATASETSLEHVGEAWVDTVARCVESICCEVGRASAWWAAWSGAIGRICRHVLAQQVNQVILVTLVADAGTECRDKIAVLNIQRNGNCSVREHGQQWIGNVRISVVSNIGLPNIIIWVWRDLEDSVTAVHLVVLQPGCS